MWYINRAGTMDPNKWYKSSAVYVSSTMLKTDGTQKNNFCFSKRLLNKT